MNVGYSAFNEKVDTMACPICSNDIYVSKYMNDFRCIDNDCLLHIGAKKIMEMCPGTLVKLEKMINEIERE